MEPDVRLQPVCYRDKGGAAARRVLVSRPTLGRQSLLADSATGRRVFAEWI